MMDEQLSIQIHYNGNQGRRLRGCKGCLALPRHSLGVPDIIGTPIQGRKLRGFRGPQIAYAPPFFRIIEINWLKAETTKKIPVKFG